MIGNLSVGTTNDVLSLVGNFQFVDTSSAGTLYNFEGFFIEYNGLLGLYTPETAQTL